jgi:Holliday junction resolvasome RuvABC endonuclease subunit
MSKNTKTSPLISLHLDMATKTGFALARGNQLTDSGVVEFKARRGESEGMRFIRFKAWLREMVAQGVGLIVYEDAIRHHKSGAAAAVAHGLAASMKMIVAQAKEDLDVVIETMPVKPTEVKKLATGKGNAGKKAMKEAAIAAGLDPVIDDNHADAFWIFKYAEDQGWLA